MSEREIEGFVDTIGKKSCDIDPIPASILKECKSALLPILTNIVNMSPQSASMPTAVKEAAIKPKLKKDNQDSEDYSNFRPISNLKVITKIIEKAVSCQLSDHVRDNDLEESFQSVYKHFHSAETALLRVQNDVLLEIDNQKCVVMLLWDMSAAFDTVDHDLLLEPMEKRYGVKGNVLKWFRSYLQDRKQFVTIDGNKSKTKELRYGVPQGSVLGPILYLFYTSPIRDIIRRHGLNCHLYADDIQLYLPFKPNPAEQPSSIAKIEACVSEIDSLMVCNQLKLNREKTELLILSARHRPPPLVEYVDVSGERIQPSPSARNIGVIFDVHMSLDKHITSTCKACFFHLRNISKIRDFLSLADTEKLPY
ncbi:putative RNA-directed DNA polymerase from transposon BS [Stylophora pistillata]|uniref:Putative RNA-directed DNA polymerase from transposon BS n=1 Tax=Stylophora pistillata TaxID=50429 RepID=A0A2B4R5K8_STYPI|nr:putative RNA-directed DNA polymerase from transposon BS [Stylophora pistillata]